VVLYRVSYCGAVPGKLLWPAELTNRRKFCTRTSGIDPEEGVRAKLYKSLSVTHIEKDYSV